MGVVRTAFGDWETGLGGAVLDRRNRRMWMTRRWDTPELDWVTATARFGRGAVAWAPSDMGRAEAVSKAAPEAALQRGYRQGSDVVRFAGFSDWRLPTLDEVVHISFDEVWGARKVQDGETDVLEIWSRLFEAEQCFGRFWTANSVSRYRPDWVYSLVESTFGTKRGDWHAAWGFSCQNSPPIICDDSATVHRSVLLVRGES